MSTTPSTTTSTTTPTGVDVIQAFLDAIRAGAGIPADLYEPDAVLDATVPNWRFVRRGRDVVASEYSGWFTAPAVFEALERVELPDGALITYLLTWTESGVPHAAHHCHRLRVGPTGRIAADTVFCGGRWPASLLAEMGAQW